MQYISMADESATRNETQTAPSVADCTEIRLIAPQQRVTKADPRCGESSFDLHHGLDMREDQIDTLHAELFDELFK